jgi:DNA modification methylase
MILIGDFKEALSNVYDIDLILTDPPYPHKYMDCFSELSAFAKDHLAENGVLLCYSGLLYLPEVLARLGENMTYRWMLSLNHSGPGANLVDKFQSRWKPILLYTKNKDSIIPTAGDTYVSPKREKDAHPWQQNIEVASKLIVKYSKPGDLVVDCFAGSGAFVVAAESSGRIGVGADIGTGGTFIKGKMHNKRWGSAHEPHQ